MDRKLVYKVVNKTSIDFESCSAPPEAALVYNMNEWTRPTIPGSKIFVFDTEDNARMFAGMQQFILACEYEGKPIPIHTRLGVGHWIHFQDFWQNIQRFTERMYHLIWIAPDGSLGVDAVRPVVLIGRGGHPA